MLKLPPKTSTEAFVAMGGGIDLTTAGSMVAPGALIGAENYEPAISGGYARIGGYERFDGRPSPSLARVRLFAPAGTPFEACVVGQTLTGSVSGATGVVAYADGQLIALTKVVGTFIPSENLLRGAELIGSTRQTEPSIYPTQLGELLSLAADLYRADIGPIPGAGPVRGGAILNNEVFGFRDNEAGTACGIWKASPTGWQAVPLLWEVAFTGGVTEYAEGSTLTRGGVTATVKRVILELGEWGPGATGAGRMVITAPVGGNFTAGAATGGGACTLSGPATAIALAPGGRWIWRAHNFTGSADTLRLYGCDGVNRPFEFDGEVMAPLNTGMPADMPPQVVEVHRNQLFFAFEGSVQHSAPGDAYRWTPVRGAGELGAGDRVTGLLSVSGGETSAALMVSCRNSTHVIYGYGADDWQMVNLSRSAGAKPYSLRQLFSILALDDQGVRTVSTTQAFGNFSFDTATDRLRRLAVSIEPAASLIDPVNGRYKLLTASGYGLVGAPFKKSTAWAPIRLAHDVNATCEGELDGQAVMFFGGSSGYLYQLDRGRSFDGLPIKAWLRTAFASMGSAQLRKRFQTADLELRGESAGQLRAMAEFSYGDLDVRPTPVVSGQFAGPATPWDAGQWDEGSWDGLHASRVRVRIEGTGINVSLILNSTSKSELPHELVGYWARFIPRRSER